jgi:CRP/FNR family transcriptional regulator, cyclic AMP receptor protein
MTARRMFSLLDLDPDLGQLLPPERRPTAQAQLQVEVHRLAAGPWSSDRLAGANPEHVGLLLIDGVISREVLVSDTVSTELLGPGDILRPWALHDNPSLLQMTVRWNALTECRIAVLDRRLGARLTQFPEVNSVLIDRLNDRAERLATTQAVSQLNRVDRRLLALFWHLAERWGRMTSDGVVVPLTLSHRMLGQLVGARRPTVSTAIGELARRDELVRRDDGTWLLKGEPVGVPSEAVQRVVPIRRRLLAPEPAEETAAVEAETAPDVEIWRTAAAELRATAERLRTDSRTQLEALERVAIETEQLRRRTAKLREERREARNERGDRVTPA